MLGGNYKIDGFDKFLQFGSTRHLCMIYETWKKSNTGMVHGLVAQLYE